ncbi:hypothetical protein [Vibrio coralliirubri]|uniref:hypothetical protein n=1 Tax=Vibrio coralliirubri TaxID=1516159 RepID=UPI00076AC7EA|nr:hypothetical protein [Vibrio coralliirubri]
MLEQDFNCESIEQIQDRDKRLLVLLTAKDHLKTAFIQQTKEDFHQKILDGLNSGELERSYIAAIKDNHDLSTYRLLTHKSLAREAQIILFLISCSLRRMKDFLSADDLAHILAKHDGISFEYNFSH